LVRWIVFGCNWLLYLIPVAEFGEQNTSRRRNYETVFKNCYKAYITNTNGGHWVPTGETMRSVMLLLKVFDSSGKRLEMAAGKRLPSWTGKGKVEDGNYAGESGAVFARVLGDDGGNLKFRIQTI